MKYKTHKKLEQRELNIKKYVPILECLNAEYLNCNQWMLGDFIITISDRCKARHRKFKTFIVNFEDFLQNQNLYYQQAQECQDRVNQREQEKRKQRQQAIIDKINDLLK